MTEWVKVTDILKNVEYSVDFGYVDDASDDVNDDKRTEFWKRVIKKKSNDTGFGHLVDSILENGWDETSCVGWNHGSDITEGHHRIVAAILLCIDEVPVTSYGVNLFRPGGGMAICSHSNWEDPYPMSIEV